jgi:hypothetical protein
MKAVGVIRKQINDAHPEHHTIARGAFTARNNEAVTEVFRYGLMQIPFFYPSAVCIPGEVRET